MTLPSARSACRYTFAHPASVLTISSGSQRVTVRAEPHDIHRRRMFAQRGEIFGPGRVMWELLAGRRGLRGKVGRGDIWVHHPQLYRQSLYPAFPHSDPFQRRVFDPTFQVQGWDLL